MRDCFVEVDVKEGKMFTKTCKEYIAELEAKIHSLVNNTHSEGLSSTDSARSQPEIILTPHLQCGEFFLVPVLGWNNDGSTRKSQETVKCARPQGHPNDEFGHVTVEGWRSKNVTDTSA